MCEIVTKGDKKVNMKKKIVCRYFFLRKKKIQLRAKMPCGIGALDWSLIFIRFSFFIPTLLFTKIPLNHFFIFFVFNLIKKSN